MTYRPQFPAEAGAASIVAIDLIPLGRQKGLLITCHDVTDQILPVNSLQQRISTLQPEGTMRQVELQLRHEQLHTFCDYMPNTMF